MANIFIGEYVVGEEKHDPIVAEDLNELQRQIALYAGPIRTLRLISGGRVVQFDSARRIWNGWRQNLTGLPPWENDEYEDSAMWGFWLDLRDGTQIREIHAVLAGTLGSTDGGVYFYHDDNELAVTDAGHTGLVPLPNPWDTGGIGYANSDPYYLDMTAAPVVVEALKSYYILVTAASNCASGPETNEIWDLYCMVQGGGNV